MGRQPLHGGRLPRAGLVFADGGLTALGLNIIVMGYVTCFVGYGIYLLLRAVVPSTRAGVTVSAVAAWFGVVASALVFVLYYAVGGTTDVSLATVAGAMVGVHALVGIGEAVLTG